MSELATYQTAFAPRDGEPLFPELWKDCVFAANPGLGPSGLTLRDWSGRGNHGTLTNGPTWGPVGGRQGLSFDGGDDEVRLSQMIAMTGDFSVSIWCRCSNFSSNRILCGETAAGWSFIGFLGSSSTVYFRCGENPNPLRSFAIANPPSAGDSFNLVLARRSGVVRCWLNGRESATVVASDTGTFRVNSVGGYPVTPTFGWLGAIYDFSVYQSDKVPNIATLATRPGIAYELAPERRGMSEAQHKAYLLALRNQIIGGGLS